MKKLFTKLIAFVLLIGILGTAGLIVGYQQLQKPVSDTSETYVFTVSSGSTVKSVASQLKGEGLVRSSFVVEVVARLQSLQDIKAGNFIIDSSWDVKEILTVINDATKTISNEVSITFIEGSWAKDFALKLSNMTSVSEEELLTLWNNEDYVRSLIESYEFLTEEIFHPAAKVLLEGYLFPETYNFFVDTTAEAVTKRLLDQTNRIYQRNKQLFDQSDRSIHEIFTLASIVQFEASKVEDMKLVASVFYNRLAINMPLQSSVTICYALYEYDDWRACESNPNIESLYNTYKYQGLTPGPILNPGEQALIATLQPATSDYLFFMADVYGDGTVYYARTYAEHQANVDKYLRGR